MCGGKYKVWNFILISDYFVSIIVIYNEEFRNNKWKKSVFMSNSLLGLAIVRKNVAKDARKHFKEKNPSFSTGLRRRHSAARRNLQETRWHAGSVVGPCSRHHPYKQQWLQRSAPCRTSWKSKVSGTFSMWRPCFCPEAFRALNVSIVGAMLLKIPCQPFQIKGIFKFNSIFSTLLTHISSLNKRQFFLRN